MGVEEEFDDWWLKYSKQGPQLTERQQQIMVLAMEGFKINEMAKELKISSQAVRGHVQRIEDKLEKDVAKFWDQLMMLKYSKT